jgi:hypothetical protein
MCGVYTVPVIKVEATWHVKFTEGKDANVTDTAPDGWSPADNPYAIAVSESQWWLRAARLAILRIRDGDDHRVSFSSRQIDARFLVFALRQLLAAEQPEQVALKALDMDPTVGKTFTQEHKRFKDALPGIKHMRDALMHFDAWSHGEGYGPQKERRQAGEALRNVAHAYWGFAYDPIADTISLGPAPRRGEPQAYAQLRGRRRPVNDAWYRSVLPSPGAATRDRQFSRRHGGSTHKTSCLLNSPLHPPPSVRLAE